MSRNSSAPPHRRCVDDQIETLRRIVVDTFGPDTTLTVTEHPAELAQPPAYTTPHALQATLLEFAQALEALVAFSDKVPPHEAVPGAVGYAQTWLHWPHGKEQRSLAQWRTYSRQLADHLRRGARDLQVPKGNPPDEVLRELNTSIGIAVWVATADVATKDIRAVLRVLDGPRSGDTKRPGVRPGRASEHELAKAIQKAAGEMIVPAHWIGGRAGLLLRDVAPALKAASP